MYLLEYKVDFAKHSRSQRKGIGSVEWLGADDFFLSFHWNGKEREKRKKKKKKKISKREKGSDLDGTV